MIDYSCLVAERVEENERKLWVSAIEAGLGDPFSIILVSFLCGFPFIEAGFSSFLEISPVWLLRKWRKTKGSFGFSAIAAGVDVRGGSTLH